jgi:two-component system, response regulator
MQPKLNVLLVDDDEDEGMILEEALSRIDGRIRLKQINSCDPVDLRIESPDIAFVDINMPQVNGYEWVSKSRSHGFTFPIVMYSTSNSEEHIHAALKSGADYYYTKQGDFKTLLRVVRQILFDDQINIVM